MRARVPRVKCAMGKKFWSWVNLIGNGALWIKPSKFVVAFTAICFGLKAKKQASLYVS